MVSICRFVISKTIKYFVRATAFSVLERLLPRSYYKKNTEQGENCVIHIILVLQMKGREEEMTVFILNNLNII